MSIVVSDTSPIRALDHVGILDALPALFGEVVVPPAVVAELGRAWPTMRALTLADLPGVRVETPRDARRVESLRSSLDAGESEAIALALELRAATILIDERRGRTTAQRLGLNTVGALGILLEAKRIGRIAAVAPLMEQLETGIAFRISPALKAATLRLARE